jgi:hypothetical protein
VFSSEYDNNVLIDQFKLALIVNRSFLNVTEPLSLLALVTLNAFVMISEFVIVIAYACSRIL